MSLKRMYVPKLENNSDMNVINSVKVPADNGAFIFIMIISTNYFLRGIITAVWQ